MLQDLDKQIHKFIYAGQNEHPILAINFHPKNKGGLGLICPCTKARALLLKGMLKD